MNAGYSIFLFDESADMCYYPIFSKVLHSFLAGAMLAALLRFFLMCGLVVSFLFYLIGVKFLRVVDTIFTECDVRVGHCVLQGRNNGDEVQNVLHAVVLYFSAVLYLFYFGRGKRNCHVVHSLQYFGYVFERFFFEYKVIRHPKEGFFDVVDI